MHMYYIHRHMYTYVLHMHMYCVHRHIYIHVQYQPSLSLSGWETRLKSQYIYIHVYIYD